ncbi:FAD-binding oxidoreductase [Inhella sp.]|uniref:FAD-binding oxidoreductase n=1 Tax=Inhella sp. TaxID=1921806 RepID=UPI0035B372FB
MLSEAPPKRCHDRAEVLRLVQEANRRGWALYPYSTGLNWGYGGSQPPRAGCVPVDLSGMKRILNADQISVSHPVAVIEPGVTQGQLADFLAERHPGLSFNVTGSARGTSLIGNALDRGVGYLGPRREDLFGLEVVTGRGDLLHTGFRRLGEHSELANLHPYGLGPMLDGLFFQGNFGIVTSACFRLLPRLPEQVAVSLALHDANRLGEFIDVLAALKRENVMHSVTHIGNQARTRASLSHGMHGYLASRCGLSGAELDRALELALEVVAPGEWTSLGGVGGTAAQVRSAMSEVRHRMRGLARVMVVTEERLNLGLKLFDALRKWPFARAQAAAISAVMPLHGLAVGRPTDVAIDNLLWKFGQPHLPAVRFEDSRCGVLFVSPALPMRGAYVQNFIAEMVAVAERFGHTLFTTLNIETPLALVAICNLLFDRESESERQRALDCATALQALVRERGLSVYRARADMMGEIADPADPYWRLVRELKQVFDPNNVIAPGRYNLP